MYIYIKQVGVLQQSLEFLVEGGPVTDQLPSGFKAVLPAGTEMNVNLKDGVEMDGKPVVIRTLDIGGDKELPYMAEWWQALTLWNISMV